MVIGAVEEMLGGGDVLWKVLNAFVTRYRYRCYSSALFEAEIVSWVRQNQGKKESESIKRFLQTWIHSPGLPQVKAVLSRGKLVLIQVGIVVTLSPTESVRAESRVEPPLRDPTHGRVQTQERKPSHGPSLLHHSNAHAAPSRGHDVDGHLVAAEHPAGLATASFIVGAERLRRILPGARDAQSLPPSPERRD